MADESSRRRLRNTVKMRRFTFEGSMTAAAGLSTDGFGFVAYSGARIRRNGSTGSRTCGETLLDGIQSENWKR